MTLQTKLRSIAVALCQASCHSRAMTQDTLPPHIAAELAQIGIVAKPAAKPPRPTFAPGWKPTHPQDECPF